VFRTLDGQGSLAGDFASLGLAPGNLPVVSYLYLDSLDLRLTSCADSRCDEVTTRTLDGDLEEGLYTSLAVRADGTVFVSDFEQSAGDLKLAVLGEKATPGPVIFRDGFE
jgi:hypothetical protein